MSEPNLQEIVEGIRNAFVPQPILRDTARATPSVFIPVGYAEHVISRLTLPAPLRIEQTVTTRRIADFIAYVNKYKNADSLLVIAPEVSFNGDAIVTAVLDYHQPRGEPQPSEISGVPPAPTFEKPKWGFHTVRYAPQISPAYALLTKFANALHAQDVFTQQFRNVMRFVTSMEHADMLELLRTLNLTSKGAFKSIEDPISGSVDFAYDVQVQAQAGTAEKRLTIPESVKFKMPILHDGNDVEIVAELRYRVPNAEEGGKKVQLGIELVNRVWDEFDQLAVLGARVAGETELLTIVGDSKNNYAANSK